MSFAERWSQLKEHAELLARHDVARAASAIAFHTFFSLVPLFAITGWVAHRLALTKASLMAPLLSVAPNAVRALADAEFMRLGDSADNVLPPLSIAMFLWLSSGGTAVTMRVFEHLFGNPRRNWLKRRLLALAFVLCALVVISATGGVVVAAVWLGSAVAGIVALIAPLVGLWLLLGTFFRFATLRKQGRRPIGFPGAALTLILWIAVSALFGLYVRTLASYSQFYGGLATVVVLLVWLWLMAFALLAGGALNAVLEKRHALTRG